MVGKLVGCAVVGMFVGGGVGLMVGWALVGKLVGGAVVGMFVGGGVGLMVGCPGKLVYGRQFGVETRNLENSSISGKRHYSGETWANSRWR